jgi:tRNA (mo5U34)-methyltransferase
MSKLVFNTRQLSARLRDTPLAAWSEALGDAVHKQDHALKHGHLGGWEQAVNALPVVPDARWSIAHGSMHIRGSFSEQQTRDLEASLSALMPWRKGPYTVGPVFIDTEWRSDWKWERIAPHLQPLQDRTVLDVGCGSGYHLWRLRDAGARLVLGIDPSLLYLKQFDAIQHFAREPAIHFLPLAMESLPSAMHVFDTVFSMGVLYHRRDPLQHLAELHQCLRTGGELVLETLIVAGQAPASLPVADRYANMRNIYELPSIARLEHWVREAGYTQVRTVSVNQTSRQEQRSTRWMHSHSLAQALDPDDPSLTVEGYPRPLRAVVMARA